MPRGAGTNGDNAAALRSSRLIVAVIAVLLAGAPAVAAQTPAPRIINGGAPTQPWPAQTSVRFKVTASTNGLCGGTLVSARWVLTAGHCVTNPAGDVRPPADFNYDLDKDRLRIGSTSRTTGGDTATVDQVLRHDSFARPGDGTIDYDVALLHLTAPVPEEPLRMIGGDASEARFWAGGVVATIIGWGVTKGGAQSSDALREARAPMLSDADCAAAWPGKFDPASMVCAGDGTSDACSGDSGGPLMVPRGGAFQIVGVTSWGSASCGDANFDGYAGAYARLGAPAINDWIRRFVPMVTFAPTPAVPLVGAPVTISAVPAQADGTALTWDTNGDGVFDDAAGPSVTMVFPAAGAYNIAVRATYPDGDRSAIARDPLPVVDPPPPPPPPSPPAPPPPPSGGDRPLSNGVGVTSKMKLITLRTKGVRVRYQCVRACSISGRLSLGPVSARRFGLSRGSASVTIASATGRLLQSGSGTLTLKLTPRAKLALRNRDRITMSVITTLRAGTATLPGKNPVSVRR